MRKKQIIFDLDGTLWDTTKEVEFVWSEIAKKYNLEIKKEQINEIMGLTKEEIIEYFFNDNIELGNKFITECQEQENKYLLKNGGNIYENTIQTIKSLYENYELYIVSNCQAGYIESFLDYYDLRRYFRDFESSGNTGKEKEENIKLIMERNNIIDSVYVGDTQKDFKASLVNNIKFIWAKYGFGKCENATQIIEDISDLINVNI